MGELCTKTCWNIGIRTDTYIQPQPMDPSRAGSYSYVNTTVESSVCTVYVRIEDGA